MSSYCFSDKDFFKMFHKNAGAYEEISCEGRGCKILICRESRSINAVVKIMHHDTTLICKVFENFPRVLVKGFFHFWRLTTTAQNFAKFTFLLTIMVARNHVSQFPEGRHDDDFRQVITEIDILLFLRGARA